MKPFAKVLLDRGVDPETARIVASVIERELKGGAFTNRSQSEREAVERAEEILEKAIQAYG